MDDDFFVGQRSFRDEVVYFFQMSCLGGFDCDRCASFESLLCASSGDLEMSSSWRTGWKKERKEKVFPWRGGERQRRRREWVMRTASCSPVWVPFKLLHSLMRRAAERWAALVCPRSGSGKRSELKEAPNQKQTFKDLIFCSLLVFFLSYFLNISFYFF